MKFTETQLTQYSAPLSSSEEQKCKNAIGMVRDALKTLGFTDDGKEIRSLYEGTLAYTIELRAPATSRKVKLFVQGSYANNTNVRTQSDVDIAVVEENVFRTHYRDSHIYPQNDKDYGFTVASPTSKTFKDEVQDCLVEKFGNDVERKNKSIKVHGNTYRKDADTVPCLRYRDYSNDYRKDSTNYVGGIVIFPDDKTGPIINYPEQHIFNGKKKNVETHSYYKKMVRIMKKMRYLMEECGITEAQNVSSFALESLLWNIPNEFYLEYGDFRKVYMFHQIIQYLKKNRENWGTYLEANGIKRLFHLEKDISNMKTYIERLDEFYTYE